jgi:hypothetical protein
MTSTISFIVLLTIGTPVAIVGIFAILGLFEHHVREGIGQ